MSSPALLVLFSALVCSIFGTASEQTADHGRKLKHVLTLRDQYINMGNRRTNVYNHIDYVSFNDKFKSDNGNENVNYNNEDNRDVFYSNANLIKEPNVVEDFDEVRKTNNKLKAKIEFDDIYTENDDIVNENLKLHKLYVENRNRMRQYDESKYHSKHRRIQKRVKRQEDSEANCDGFTFNGKDQTHISHPHGKNNNNYYLNSTDCVTVINGTEGTVIQLTFVDMFHIEYHAECAYDYLEIRDGLHGYARLLAKVCGKAFPPQITSSGPSVWLKFHSDDTIEYEGFHIDVNFVTSPTSHVIPESCYKTLEGQHGVIDTANIDPDCISKSSNQALDVLWTIEAPENTKIYLNFTSYSLAKPNECEDNVVQVFGAVLEFQSKLAHYCGSMANAVNTKGNEKGKGSNDRGNIMYVRLYASKAAKTSSFNATFTAYRTLDPNKDEKCDEESEFDCEDNTCIAKELKCDKYAHCRLKADEDYELCKGETESVISQPHILVILVIFSLILSGMSFVFLFKCIKKLYQDHKIIKEHIRQSCEDRLDSLVDARLTLDAKRLRLESEPRASLERENHTNEMFKKQRKFSPSSIDSDFDNDENHLHPDDEGWRRDLTSIPVDTEDIMIERNGRRRRSDISKKERSLRSKGSKESEESKEKKEMKEIREIRDASVGAPDTKESGCQTRESLFQTEPAPSSDSTNSGSNSRGFSTFGYSGATLVRPSPPAPPTNTSEITIELLRQVTPQESIKSQKRMSDRRPMSSETTRSAPDVIIVSKPVY